MEQEQSWANAQRTGPRLSLSIKKVPYPDFPQTSAAKLYASLCGDLARLTISGMSRLSAALEKTCKAETRGGTSLGSGSKARA